MKTKRIAALLLTVCLMLSMGIVPVWALEAGETETYSFDYIKVFNADPLNKGYTTSQKWSRRAWLPDLFADGTINNTPIGTTAAITDATKVFDIGGFSVFTTKIGQWVAIKFKSPDTAGTYSVTVNWNNSGANTQSCGVYILPESAESDIAGNLNDNALIGTVNLEKDEMTGIAGDITLEASTNYIVVFKALKDTYGGDDTAENAAIRLVSMGLTLKPGASGPVDIADQINNATSGMTITLEADAETTKDITIADGVTLDLNGHTLTAPSVTAFGTGSVIDGDADKTGLLKVAADELVLTDDSAQFPLYDSVNEGYRFYTANLEELDPKGNAYYFRLKFSHSSAYDLIANGDSGLKIGVKMTWEGLEEDVFAYPDASTGFYTNWANAVKNSETIAIKVTVNGTENVSKFALQPIYSGLN